MRLMHFWFPLALVAVWTPLLASSSPTVNKNGQSPCLYELLSLDVSSEHYIRLLRKCAPQGQEDALLVAAMKRRERGLHANSPTASRTIASFFLQLAPELAPGVSSSGQLVQTSLRGAVADLHARDLLIQVNGQQVYSTRYRDPAKTPIFRNDIVLVPARTLVTAVGGTVSYVGSRDPVMLSRSSRTVFLVVGSRTATVNTPIGVSTGPVAPELHDGVLFVPLRWIAQELGAFVQWRGAHEMIDVGTRQSAPLASSRATVRPNGTSPAIASAGTVAGPSTLKPAATTLRSSTSATTPQPTQSPTSTRGGIFDLPTLPPEPAPQPSPAKPSRAAGKGPVLTPTPTPSLRTLLLDLVAAPSDATENASAMVDFIVLLLLLAIIAALSALLVRAKASKPPLEMGFIKYTQAVIAVLLIFQMIVVLLRPTNTVPSMGHVMHPIMQGVEQLFILLTVVAVVSLGVYLSYRQFHLWEAGQHELLAMTGRLTGGVGSPESAQAAPRLPEDSPASTSARADGGTVGTSPAQPSLPSNVTTATTIKMSTQGITIITPIVGLTVLVISLGFLYLFLHWAVISPVH